MKIVYTIAGFYRQAGMERVLANKARYFVQQGHEVFIVTTDQRCRERAFQLPESVKLYDLGINYEENNESSFMNKMIHYPGKQIKHFLLLRSLLNKIKADVVVSMFCNDASFVPRINDGSKKILEIHFSRYKRLQYGRTGLWAVADRLRSVYDLSVVTRFDSFVVLTEEDKQYWGALPNISVIPNSRSFSTSNPSDLTHRIVIAVGRYNYQKDFESLLEIWSMTEKQDWKLWIVGDGEERDRLLHKIISLNLQDSVILGKAEVDMQHVYQSASILALSSRFEGLPMVLLEAQSMGLPIVSYACKCGPRDVITDGVDGFLIEQGDKATFADKLSLLISRQDLREQMGSAAYSASDRFDEFNIMSQWDRLFKELL